MLLGIFVVIFYAVDVVQEAGVTMDKYLATIFIGVARLVVTIAVSIAMRKFGRRPLAILSGAGMALCMIPLSAHLFINSKRTIFYSKWIHFKNIAKNQRHVQNNFIKNNYLSYRLQY